MSSLSSRNFPPPNQPDSFTSLLPPPSAPYSISQRGVHDFAQPYRHYQSQQPQQTSPTDSLNAALREGADFLPRRLSFPRLPPLSRPTSAAAAQQSHFGYIPEHFFYSPPQSPQNSSQPSNTAEPAPSYPFAGPPSNQPVAGPSQPRANPADMPSTSASTPTSSRKRQRPSFSDDSIPSATKRRIHIDLDDEDEDDDIEELGPDSDLLAKQREELVNKQREESNKITRIGDLNCMICLEHFTNMTATHCGMLSSILRDDMPN